MATFLGGDAKTANALSVSVTLPSGLQTGDKGLLEHIYNPGVGALTPPAGWTLITERVFSASMNVAYYERDLSAALSGTTVVVSNAVTQKLTSAVAVFRGPTGRDGAGSFFHSTVSQLTQSNPSKTTGTRDITVAFFAHRGSTPPTDVAPPAGFTLPAGCEVFSTGAGATGGAVAYSLSEVTTGGSIGGGDWTMDVANSGVVTAVFGLTVPTPTVNPYDGRGLKYHLNRKAGTLVGDMPTVEAQRAANIWAGTTNLDLLGALNAKAGNTTYLTKRELAGVLNQLAGTQNLEVDGAAASIP